MNSNNPMLSIITVVYNGIDTIEKTIQSVASQTYKNIEYIVIDGASKDGTLEVIKKYPNIITNWISETDKGLYDAMNKGLTLAKGKYVCFLNSGDTFYELKSLENIFSQFQELPDIIYGETMIVDADGNEIGDRRLKAPENLSWKSFRDGMLVCHQSIFVKRNLAEPYNLKYRISADFEWVLKALKKAQSIHNSHIYIARFLDGGINKKNIRRGLTERFSIMISFYGFLPVLLRHFVIGTKFFWYWFRNKRF